MQKQKGLKLWGRRHNKPSIKISYSHSSDHGAGAVELVSAVWPEPADVCAQYLLGQAEDYKKATQRVYHAPGETSAIELPVVEGQ
jgi:hypothetical protein